MVGVDDMTLGFDGFQVILLFVSVLLVCSPHKCETSCSMLTIYKVNYLIGDGKSHWLEGVLLMMMYLIIALAAWYVACSPGHTDPSFQYYDAHMLIFAGSSNALREPLMTFISR